MTLGIEGKSIKELVSHFGLDQKKNTTSSTDESNDFDVLETAEMTFLANNTILSVQTKIRHEVEQVKLLNFLNESFEDGMTLKKEVRSVLNEFLEKLSESTDQNKDDSKMMKSIREIENDWTFLVYFELNIIRMWS